MPNCFKCKHLELRDDRIFECTKDNDDTFDLGIDDDLKLLLNAPCGKFEPKNEQTREVKMSELVDCRLCADYRTHRMGNFCEGGLSTGSAHMCDCYKPKAGEPESKPTRRYEVWNENKVYRGVLTALSGELPNKTLYPYWAEIPSPVCPDEPNEPEPSKAIQARCDECQNGAVGAAVVNGTTLCLCNECLAKHAEEPACPFCQHVGSHKPPVHHICNACKCWFTPETTPKVEEPKPSKAFDWLCDECKVAAKSGGAISLCRNCMSTYEALEPEPVKFKPGTFYTSPFTVEAKRDGESRYFVNGQPMRPDKEKPECPYCGDVFEPDHPELTEYYCGECHNSFKLETSYTTTGVEKDGCAAESSPQCSCIKPEMSLRDNFSDGEWAGAPCPLCSCVDGEVTPCDATGEDRKPGAPCPVCSGEVPE